MLNRPDRLPDFDHADCRHDPALRSAVAPVGQSALSKLARQLTSRLRKPKLLKFGEETSHFRRVFDLSSVGMLWASPDGCIIRSNQSMAELTGYTSEELANMRYEQLLPPEDHEEYRSVLSREVRTKQSPADRERRYLRKDGEIVWGLRSVTLVLSPSNALLQKFVVIQDITKRRQAEQALLEEEHALAIINRTAERLNAELGLEAVLRSVTDAGVELVGAEFGALYSARNFSGDGCQLHSLSGITRPEFDKLPVTKEIAAVFQPVFDGARVVRWDDIPLDTRFAVAQADSAAPPMRSCLVVPLFSRSKDVTGALLFGHAQPGAFTERSERIMTGLASHAALAIEKASLFDAAQSEIEHANRCKPRSTKARRASGTLRKSGPTCFGRRTTSSASPPSWAIARRSRFAGRGHRSAVRAGKSRGSSTDDQMWRRHVEDHQAWRPFRNFRIPARR